MRLCTFDGCQAKHFGRGLCKKHYMRWWKHGHPAIVLTKPHVVRHGTNNEYSNYGCRCEDCRAAAIEYQRRVQSAPCVDCGAPCWGGPPSRGGRCRACAIKARTYDLDELHGTETGYSRGCRCSECRRAIANARRRRRHANMEATRAYERERYLRRKASRQVAA